MLNYLLFMLFFLKDNIISFVLVKLFFSYYFDYYFYDKGELIICLF